MSAIYVKLRRRSDSLANIDSSKFLGDPVIPAEFDADKTLGDDEIFLCQLDCSQIRTYDTQGLLPDCGWLWFFVDLEDYPYTPRVIYSSWGPEFVLEEYNEEWVEDTTKAYAAVFSDKAKESSGVVLLPATDDDKVVLLRIEPEKAQLGLLAGAGGAVSFVIDRAALANKDFSAVRLVVE